MAKKELFFFPLGPLIRSVGSFPVSRGEGDSAAIRRTLDELSQGNSVLMFPEGTRGDTDHLGAIQMGLAMIAKKSGAQIVPVGIFGTHTSLPKSRSIPRRAKFVVAFGEPFTYDQIATENNERANRAKFVGELQKRLINASQEAGLSLLPPKIDEQT
jgi:1-acyl-sn-glycerol-3-phosphate acyltransferase